MYCCRKVVQKLDRGADGSRFVAGECKVDRNDVGTLVEDLIVSLAQQFRHACRRFHQQQQSAACVCRFSVGQDPVELLVAPDKIVLRHAAEDAPEVFTGAAPVHLFWWCPTVVDVKLDAVFARDSSPGRARDRRRR